MPRHTGPSVKLKVSKQCGPTLMSVDWHALVASLLHNLSVDELSEMGESLSKGFTGSQPGKTGFLMTRTAHKRAAQGASDVRRRSSSPQVMLGQKGLVPVFHAQGRYKLVHVYYFGWLGSVSSWHPREGRVCRCLLRCSGCV